MPTKKEFIFVTCFSLLTGICLGLANDKYIAFFIGMICASTISIYIQEQKLKRNNKRL